MAFPIPFSSSSLGMEPADPFAALRSQLATPGETFDSILLKKTLEDVFEDSEALNQCSWDVFELLVTYSVHINQENVLTIIDWFLQKLIEDCNAREMFLWATDMFQMSDNAPKTKRKLIFVTQKIIENIPKKQEIFIKSFCTLLVETLNSVWRKVKESEKENQKKSGPPTDGAMVLDPSIFLMKAQEIIATEIPDLLEHYGCPIISFLFSFAPNRFSCFSSPLLGCYLILLELFSYQYALHGCKEMEFHVLYLTRFLASSLDLKELLLLSIPDDGLVECHDFPSVIISSSKGIAWLWLHLLAEQNISCHFFPFSLPPLLLLRGISVHIHSLLQTEIPFIISNAMNLLDCILAKIEKSAIHACASFWSVDHIYVLIFQQLINGMSKHPDEKERKRIYVTFCQFLACFSDSSQFHVLSVLIRYCPFSSVLGELIHQQKETILRIWKSPSAHSRILIFSSGRFLEKQLDAIQNEPTAPLGSIDKCMNYLNILRFLLLLDRTEKKTHIWDPSYQEKLIEKYLRPQIEHSNALLSNYSKTWQAPPSHQESSKRALDDMAKNIGGLSIPKLSTEGFKEGTMHSMTNLQVMIDLTERILEIVKGK